MTDHDALLDLVARSLVDVVADTCTILLLADQGWLEVVTVYSRDPEVAQATRALLSAERPRIGQGLTGQAVLTGQSLYLPATSLDAMRSRVREDFWPLLERIGLGALLVVPLRARGRSLGALALSRFRDAGPLEEADRQLAEDLTQRAALAIDSARLYRELEERVRARTEELEAANRELEAFSYSVSHDLRAPLRAVEGFAELLAERPLDDESRRLLRIIQNSAQRMGGLIEDLLALARAGRQPLHSQRVDMTALVREVVAEGGWTRPEGPIDLRVSELPGLRCDQGLLRQVWVNLLDNAVKYSRTRSAPVVEVSGERAGGEVVYRVRDNGVGFDMRFSDKLFAPFQRLHHETEFEGSGVGLALVQRIVERHGGRVRATGAIEKGACIELFLPDPEHDGA